MSAATAQRCRCCSKPIRGAALLDGALGVVCKSCGYDLRDAVKQLQRHGIRNVFTGPCGDNRKEAA